MPEAAAPAASPSPEANGSGVSVTTQSLEQRSAAAFGLPDPTVEAGSAPPAEEASAVGSVQSDQAAQGRAERRAALARLQSEERGRVDAMAAIRERDELRTKIAALESRSKDYDARIDPTSLTPEQYLALGEKLPNLDPHKLGEWLRERMANPELAAARAATSAVDPKLSALEQKIAAQQKVIDDFVAAQQKTHEDAEEAAAVDRLTEFTRSNEQHAPYAAWFLGQFGQEQFLKVAYKAVENLPPHAGDQAVLDEIEEGLAGIYQPREAVSQRRQASPPQQNHAAAQAPTTISNTLAQQRSSVVDEDSEWAALPFEERSARLFR